MGATMMPRFDGSGDNAYWWLIQVYEYFKARKINSQGIMSIMVFVRIKWGAYRWWLFWQKN